MPRRHSLVHEAPPRADGGGGDAPPPITIELPTLLDLLDRVDDALLLVAVPAARIVHANEGAGRLLGRPRADLLGQPIERVAPELDAFGLLRLSATLRDGTDGRLRWETAYRTGDGRLVAVEVSVRRALLDGEEYHVHVARDVTERRRAEAEMRRRHEELFRIFNGLEAAVYVIDPDSCRVLALNEFARRRFGEERGVRCRDSSRPRDATPCPCPRHERVRLAAESGQPLSWEFHRPEDGRWYRCIESAIPWTDDRLVRLEVTLDVTEERRLREQLRQSQKMEALGRLAGGIAHDFNNILNGILGFSELLRTATTLSSDAASHLEAIARSAARGADLTSRILGFSRRTPPALGPLDLAAPVDDATRLVSLSAPPTVRIAVDRPPDLWPIRGNAGQIEQVVLNLCVNALDAMPEGGEVTVQLGNVAPRRPLPTLGGDLPAGRYVRLRVRDTGHGMPPEDVARVFEPFYTTRSAGSQRRHSGLGLAIVWGVVQAHGGGLRVRTRPRRGTSFEVYLPASPTAPRPAETGPMRAPGRGDGELILVVDDEPTNVELARVLLERQGYRVATASDGAEAVERFAERADEIALVVLDLVMPRMDGAEAWRRIRRLSADVPVLFTTGYDAAGVEREVGDAERTGFLAKPYEPRVLLARVAAALTTSGDR